MPQPRWLTRPLPPSNLPPSPAGRPLVPQANVAGAGGAGVWLVVGVGVVLLVGLFVLAAVQRAREARAAPPPLIAAPPLIPTQPRHGEQPGVKARFLKVAAVHGSAPLRIPALGQAALHVQIFDAAGTSIPAREYSRILPPGTPPDADTVPWMGFDLGRERFVTRVTLSSLRPTLAEDSERAALQLVAGDLKPICGIVSPGKTARITFDVAGAGDCIAAHRARQQIVGDSPETNIFAIPDWETID